MYECSSMDYAVNECFEGDKEAYKQKLKRLKLQKRKREERDAQKNQTLKSSINTQFDTFEASDTIFFPDLPRFEENLRMTIWTHRPFKGKPIQPDSFALTSYIESFEFQPIWRTWRPNLSQSFFLRCPGG